MESFFEPQSEIIRADLLERIQPLIINLKNEGEKSNDSRIKFLEQVLIRLTN
jgi:hypothetical protein